MTNVHIERLEVSEPDWDFTMNAYIVRDPATGATAIVDPGAEAVRRERQRVLEAAFAAHPERFVKGRPVVPEPPKAVWINPPVVSVPSVSEPVSPSCPSGLEDAMPMLP